MPNQTDWFLLNKTINGHDENIIEIWGSINQENALIISNEKYNGKSLFEFLLENEHFSDANTIASCISLFDETNIQFIYKKHHDKYNEILQLICSDKMIILYNEYYEKMYKSNNNLLTETMDSEFINDFNNTYKMVVSEKYKMMVSDISSNDNIIDLVNEFKFLIHPYLEDFYNFCLNIKILDHVNKFNKSYEKYKEIVPLIYRLINDYFLELIKCQLKTIEDISGTSVHIITEHYENLIKCISFIPKNYVDYRYYDKSGNNILIYLAKLPYLSDPINRKIYHEFLKQIVDIPFDFENFDGNTLLHMIAFYENEIFLEIVLNWFFEMASLNYFGSPINNSENQIKTKIVNVLLIKNKKGKTIFDILLEKNNFSMLIKIIDYVPLKIYHKLTNKLIENFEIIDKIPDNKKFIQIYLDSIDSFMDVLLEMKQNILYNLDNYNTYKIKIIKLLEKCPSELTMNNNCYSEWLLICIKANEFELFKIILSKYFYNKQNQNTIDYLNKIIRGEPIIISAIREEKIFFVKNLLDYDIDLSICDETDKNAIIITLETKNLYLIRLIHSYVINIPAHQNMISVINNYIDLLDKYETFDVFSIYYTYIKFWKGLEYLINYYLYKHK